MFTEIHPCPKCGAPPRWRLAVDKSNVHFSQEYCPVCDTPSALLPYRWHRRMVWLSDHVPVVQVRFRRQWFGGRWYQQLRFRRHRKTPKPVQVDLWWDAVPPERTKQPR